MSLFYKMNEISFYMTPFSFVLFIIRYFFIALYKQDI